MQGRKLTDVGQGPGTWPRSELECSLQSMGDFVNLGVTAVWADHLNAERQHRNVIDNTERGLKFSLGDVGWAQADQTAVCKRFAAFFKEVDVLICPAASVSPIPLSRLCVEEINDKRMATYMRWLAIGYAPTMALACAATLPCGVDHLEQLTRALQPFPVTTPVL